MLPSKWWICLQHALTLFLSFAFLFLFFDLRRGSCVVSVSGPLVVMARQCLSWFHGRRPGHPHSIRVTTLYSPSTLLPRLSFTSYQR